MDYYDATIDAGNGEYGATDTMTVAVTRCAPTLPGKTGPKTAWKFTPAKVASLTESLRSFWYDSTSSLFFESWAADEHLHMRQARRLIEQDQAFAEMWSLGETIQAARLLEGATRPMDTTTNRTVYACNPKITALLCTAKFGYGPRAELAVTTPEVNMHQQIEAAERALAAAVDGLPETESQEWLTRVYVDSTDEATRESARRLLARATLINDAARAGSAICDG